ncbi:hypothetical protein DPX16_9302 [Anabarilius grahami]|uniref:Uncharacterized protein n=1 Tax=Anabarilius grahami TaxID=495550 RepID=A0A3N0Y6G6_ANAGA|nr:hypothetical protein DPX16_9302 [Anabarilius grahami]
MGDERGIYQHCGGQRLHNTELWVPSHVFVHHDDTQASAPAEMTEETGDGDGQKSSSLVPCNDIHLIHRPHTGYGSSSVQLLQHASVYQQLLWKKEVTRMMIASSRVLAGVGAVSSQVMVI